MIISYRNYNEAYHLTGDGVVVPVVRHLAEHLFEPILTRSNVKKSRMSVIPCKQDLALGSALTNTVEVLKAEAHKLGTHGLCEEDSTTADFSVALLSEFAASFPRPCGISAILLSAF